MIRRPPSSPLFPYTPLSRSVRDAERMRDPPSAQHRLGRAAAPLTVGPPVRPELQGHRDDVTPHIPLAERRHRRVDRKSTRLNSSHGYISYAVFCLKKKKMRK